MCYQVEEKETRESFAIDIHYGNEIIKEFVWAYTKEEAIEICIDRGFDVVL